MQKKLLIDVESAQCEIDGGFENEESVVILEAKNIVNEDFNVRQLYYPYRLWKKKVNKPIRLVLSIYANKIFRLFEYEFVDANNMSSIKKIKDHMYSIEDINIYWEDILEVYKNTMVEMDDKYSKRGVPFIQADSMDRIISLLENLHNNPLSEKQIAEELMGFTTRQSNYYYNAG
ncbi:TPA: type II restriction endonuclease, partial [Staphylococcus aureus]